MAATTSPGADCGTDHELLLSKIRLKLKKNTTGVAMPKYNINNIPEKFKGPVKNRYELLNYLDREPEEL